MAIRVFRASAVCRKESLSGQGPSWWPKVAKVQWIWPLWRYRDLPRWKQPRVLIDYQYRGFVANSNILLNSLQWLKVQENLGHHADRLDSLIAGVLDLKDHMSYIDQHSIYGGDQSDFTLVDRPHWEKESEIRDWQRAYDMVVPIVDELEEAARHEDLFSLVPFRTAHLKAWNMRKFITAETVCFELWSFDRPPK